MTKANEIERPTSEAVIAALVLLSVAVERAQRAPAAPALLELHEPPPQPQIYPQSIEPSSMDEQEDRNDQ